MEYKRKTLRREVNIVIGNKCTSLLRMGNNGEIEIRSKAEKIFQDSEEMEMLNKMKISKAIFLYGITV